MGTRTVSVCDVCGVEAKDENLTEWRNVTIAPVVAPLPQPTPMGLMEPAVQTITMVCHKPSCLTKWAKDQNENKAET